MTHASMPSSEGRASRESWRDIVVFGSMTIVAVALGVALHLHADVPPPIAAVAALAAQIVMVSAHLAALALFARPAPRPRRQKLEPTPRAAAQETSASATADPATSAAAATTAAAAPRPAPELFEPVALPEPPAAAEPRSPARDILDIRPGEPWVDLPPASHGSPEIAAEIAPNGPVASSEAIEQAIRGLAAVLPAERVAAVAEVAETAADVIETVGTATRAAVDIVETVTAAPAPSLPVDAITQSVEALRSAASAMREPVAARVAAVEDPAVAARRRLAEIAAAVERDSIEVALTPVVRLDDNTLRQEIVTVGLVTASGAALIPDDVAELARTSGLLGLLEALKIGRAVRIAQALEAEAPGVAVRCAVTGEALASERALNALVGTDASEPPVGRMVMLTFTADDARTFSADHWRTLSDLAALGLRFAITGVTTMEFDLAALSGFGIAALAIDFDVLSRGVPIPEGDLLPPAIVVEQLGAHGLDLIATGIDDADRVSFVAALGPVLAEGAAIALPRVIEDVVATVAAA